MINPPTGTANIQVKLSGTNAADMGASAVTFYNVDQTTPFSTPVINTGSTSTPSVTVTSAAANQFVIDVLGDSGLTQTVNSSQNLLWAYDQFWDATAASYETGITGSTTFNWTLSGGTDWVDIGVGMNPAATSTFS